MTVFKGMIAAVAISCAATSAFAVSVTPFSTPLSAGDSTFGNATASAFEAFLGTTLSFTAATNLLAKASVTINPFLVSPGGTPSNTILLSYSINGGGPTAMTISTVPVGAGSIGAAGGAFKLMAGDMLSFIINGSAGKGGNQVTFSVDTSPVPVLPAGVMLLTGLTAFAGLRRKKK